MDVNDSVDHDVAELLEIGIKSAVLVGINNYVDSNIISLTCSVNDITALQEKLIDSKFGRYDPATVELLTDGVDAPIRNKILSSLTTMARRANPEDSILFVFSGHGYEKEKIPFLLCTDSFTNTLEDTAIPLRKIREIMESSYARIKIIIIDACHSGVIKGRKDTGLMTEDFYNLFFPPPEGFIIMTSCQVNEFSYEMEDGGNGVFSHYLLEGMNGAADMNNDMIVTTEEAFNYSKNNVMKWAFNKGYKQTPEYEKTLSNDVPFMYLEEIYEQGEILQTFKINQISIRSEGFDVTRDAVNRIKLICGDLINFVDPDDIRKVSDDYVFSYGRISHSGYRNVNNEYKNYVIVSFDYRDEFVNKIKEIVNSLDNKYRWYVIYYNLDKQYNVSELVKKCKQNEFEIISYDPDEGKESIRVRTRSWENTNTTFTNKSDGSEIRIVDSSQGWINRNFFDTISPENIIEFISSSINTSD